MSTPRVRAWWSATTTSRPGFLNTDDPDVMPRFDDAQVRRYYDRHTSRFVRFGQGGSAGAIHRAVWGPGAVTREQAFHYVDEQIAQLVRRLVPASSAPHVVDLGCGVGSSLCYLAERLPIRGTGITLSGVQVRLAAERVRDAGLSGRIRYLEGDYCNLPREIGPADLAYAIESFVHGTAPARFFAESQRIIRPGGLLVLCDDFRRSTDRPDAARAIDRFSRGWHVNTLLRGDEVQALAQASGFRHESTTDLTPFLEIRRPRDRAINALVSAIRWLPVFEARVGPLIGGSALQLCLERGWVGYDLAVFRRL
jgi:SAM-dependent methyltransferase